MSLLAVLVTVALSDSMAPPGSPDAGAPPVPQRPAARWVVVCLCPTYPNQGGFSRIAVDAESVDSAGAGVYHLRLREGGWGTGQKDSARSVQIDMVTYRYDRKLWRASFDCVNRHVRSGPATFYYGSAVIPVPGEEPDGAPRGPWRSATPIEPYGDLLEAFCRFDWKKANRSG